jgi:hypothetical protein
MTVASYPLSPMAFPTSRGLTFIVALIASCGGATDRHHEATSMSGGEPPVPSNTAAAQGGAGTRDVDRRVSGAGESGASSFDWTCDPRTPVPTGLCRCPNDELSVQRGARTALAEEDAARRPRAIDRCVFKLVNAAGASVEGLRRSLRRFRWSRWEDSQHRCGR